ncbi:hypothetical protein FQN50_003312 [Emmonsiellopsis sp. PD_5]|nr:hypothetical protein FQN50_003312 [Emmonsiellopsis sp. PD_5]
MVTSLDNFRQERQIGLWNACFGLTLASFGITDKPDTNSYIGYNLHICDRPLAESMEPISPFQVAQAGGGEDTGTIILTPTRTPITATPTRSDHFPPGITSDQWLLADGLTLFWPTYTDYLYGPTTGPGAEEVSCAASWIEYKVRNNNIRSLPSFSDSWSTRTQVSGRCSSRVIDDNWSRPYTGPVTALCDEIPRALGPLQVWTSWEPDDTGPCETNIATVTTVATSYHTVGTEPTCSLGREDCLPIWETYFSRSSAYRDSHTTTVEGDTEEPIRPSACPPTVDPCKSCHFNVPSVVMYYWPVTTADGDLCAQNGTTIPSDNNPETSTTIVDDMTFTSPSVYISIDTISAPYNRRGINGVGMCGGTHSHTVISAHPTDISSVRNHRNGKYPTMGTIFPFNFAEYQPHTLGNYSQPLIPWDQYRAAPQCPLYDPACTMIRNDYYPWLDLPEALRGVDPEWTECDLHWQLPTATLVALGGSEGAKTTVDVPETATATPRSSAVPPTPIPTATSTVDGSGS